MAAPVKYSTQFNSKRPSEENLPIMKIKPKDGPSDSEGDPLEKD